MGLGAALRLQIPRTERENQLMGETRNRLVDRAADKVQDVAQKGQRVAEETMDVAKETAKTLAQDEGLATG